MSSPRRSPSLTLWQGHKYAANGATSVRLKSVLSSHCSLFLSLPFHSPLFPLFFPPISSPICLLLIIFLHSPPPDSFFSLYFSSPQSYSPFLPSPCSFPSPPIPPRPLLFILSPSTPLFSLLTSFLLVLSLLPLNCNLHTPNPDFPAQSPEASRSGRRKEAGRILPLGLQPSHPVFKLLLFLSLWTCV